MQKVQVKVGAGRARNAGGRTAAGEGAGREVRGPGARERSGAGDGSEAQPGRGGVLWGVAKGVA